MPKKELSDFLLGMCKEKGLSLRSLSIKAGLSPGAVHGILNREYEPTLYSLNRLADYLGVKRQYLWHLAGLLEDIDYAATGKFEDPRMGYYFARADKLPESLRNLLISIIAAIIAYSDTATIKQ